MVSRQLIIEQIVRQKSKAVEAPSNIPPTAAKAATFQFPSIMRVEDAAFDEVVEEDEVAEVELELAVVGVRVVGVRVVEVRFVGVRVVEVRFVRVKVKVGS